VGLKEKEKGVARQIFPFRERRNNKIRREAKDGEGENCLNWASGNISTLEGGRRAGRKCGRVVGERHGETRQKGHTATFRNGSFGTSTTSGGRRMAVKQTSRGSAQSARKGYFNIFEKTRGRWKSSKPRDATVEIQAKRYGKITGGL